jgi:hypothetical protein
MAEVKRAGLADQVDESLMITALEDTTGMPLRVSREADDVAQTAAFDPALVDPTKEGDGDRAAHPDDYQAGDD